VSDESRIIGHEYDGIREYDNPLPFWWSAIFVITIVFAGGYWFWFHGGGPGRSEHQRFAAEWKQHQTEVAAAEARTGLVVDEKLLATWARDPDVIAEGKQLFATNCVGCHLDNGRGLTGPNLTDEYQIHGSTRMDIYTTVRDGVVAKGMLAWGQTLPPKAVATVAAYATTLRATRAPEGKFPEGSRVDDFPRVQP
jgi:cytochrome c oxidase cbb3-type subunit III